MGKKGLFIKQKSEFYLNFGTLVILVWCPYLKKMDHKVIEDVSVPKLSINYRLSGASEGICQMPEMNNISEKSRLRQICSMIRISTREL